MRVQHKICINEDGKVFPFIPLQTPVQGLLLFRVSLNHSVVLLLVQTWSCDVNIKKTKNRDVIIVQVSVSVCVCVWT